MSQHDFNIANQSFPATRTDINDAILAIVSNSSGDTEPSTTYANQWWYETDTNILKIRNEANDGWVDVITLDASMTATASELNQLDAITRGSILYGNASGATARLAAGAASTVLTSDGTDISWAAAGGGGGMVYIASSGAISNAANVSFTQFDSSKYDSYEFRFIDFLPATDGAIARARTSSDGGSSYDSGASDYQLRLTGTTADNYGMLNADNLLGNAANEGFVGIVRVINPHTSTFTKVSVNDGIYVDAAANYSSLSSQAGFARKENAQVNAIQFFWSSGNIASGEVIMFGIVNS